MNSYATPIQGHYLWGICKDNEFREYMEERGIFNPKRKWYFTSVYEYFSAPRDAAILCEYDFFEKKLKKQEGQEDIDIEDDAMRYMELVHTLGNFILVPFVKKGGSFNVLRGSKSTKDYWDLALKEIYAWYKDENDEHIKSIVGKNGKNVELCKNWLKSFHIWNRFVDANMMQGFVDAEKDNEPRLFWNGHDNDKNVKPNNKDDIKEFFRNACDGIEERGKAIAEKVHRKLEELDECGLDKLADKMADLDILLNETNGA